MLGETQTRPNFTPLTQTKPLGCLKPPMAYRPLSYKFLSPLNLWPYGQVVDPLFNLVWGLLGHWGAGNPISPISLGLGDFQFGIRWIILPWAWLTLVTLKTYGKWCIELIITPQIARGMWSMIMSQEYSNLRFWMSVTFRSTRGIETWHLDPKDM